MMFWTRVLRQQRVTNVQDFGHSVRIFDREDTGVGDDHALAIGRVAYTKPYYRHASIHSVYGLELRYGILLIL